MEFNDYLTLADLPKEPYVFTLTVTEDHGIDVRLGVDLGTVKSAWVRMAFICAVLRQPERAWAERETIEYYADSQMWKAYTELCRRNSWTYLTNPEKRRSNVA